MTGPCAAPERAHRLVLSCGADSAEALAAELRAIADTIELFEGLHGFAGMADTTADLKFSYLRTPRADHQLVLL